MKNSAAEAIEALSDISEKKEPRNLGIELFRIVSMLMIVCLHVLGRGGVYSHTEPLSLNYKVAWFMETAAYCSVNCYALISGFANIKSSFKFRRIVYLWLEVWFITVSTTLIFFLFGFEPITKANWITAFFPLIKREYWYFNAYVLMSFFIPIMNKGIASLTKKQHLAIMYCLFALTTVGTFFANRDIFNLGSGYSALWLAVLYIFGSYFRLYGFPKFANPVLCLVLFFGSCTAAWGQKILIESAVVYGSIGADSELAERAGDLISYTSPFAVIMALSLLCLFAKVKIRTKFGKLTVQLLAKATFGVFLVHVGSMVWGVMYNHWSGYAKLETWKMAAAVIGTTLAVYLICSAYSIARIELFKLLRVNKLVDLVCDIPSKIRAKNKNSAAVENNDKRNTNVLYSLTAIVLCAAIAFSTIGIPMLLNTEAPPAQDSVITDDESGESSPSEDSNDYFTPDDSSDPISPDGSDVWDTADTDIATTDGNTTDADSTTVTDADTDSITVADTETSADTDSDTVTDDSGQGDEIRVFEPLVLPEIPSSPEIVDKKCTFIKDTGADTYYRIDVTYADGSELTFIDPVINLANDKKEERLNYQIKTVNELANANLDVNFYVFVPTSLEFTPILEDFIPEKTSNYPYVERFLEGLDPRIKSDSLVFKSLDERLYINYRSDLHWCDDGAYMGYCKLYNLMYEGMDYPIPPTYKVKERIVLEQCKFWGRHSRKHGISDIYDIFAVNDYGLAPHTTDPKITFEGQVERIRVNEDQTRNIYGVYFPALKYVSYPENNTGRNLLIIGDSFTQSIVELLASAFDNTYAFYISGYGGLEYNKFIEEKGITDVLVMQDAYRLVVNSDNDSHLDRVLDKSL